MTGERDERTSDEGDERAERDRRDQAPGDGRTAVRRTVDQAGERRASDEGDAASAGPHPDDLPAAAVSDAEHRRWRRLAAAAADAARLSESLDEGSLGEVEAVDALAAAHGSEPEAFEMARSTLGDREAAAGAAEQLREEGAAARARELDVEYDDVRIEVARLEARLAAARRRLAELEERRQSAQPEG